MTTTTKSELTEAQNAELMKLEKQIKRGQEAFFVTCRALVEIEAKKLYVRYGSLADYAAEKWEMTPPEVSHYKAAARVLEILEGFGKSKMPKNPAQARELAKLKDDPEGLQEVWKRVLAKKGKTTASMVRTEVRRYLKKDAEETLEPAAEIEVKIDPVQEIVKVVHYLQGINDGWGEQELDDESRAAIEEQLWVIDEIAAKLRSRLSPMTVAAA